VTNLSKIFRPGFYQNKPLLCPAVGLCSTGPGTSGGEKCAGVVRNAQIFSRTFGENSSFPPNFNKM
ncbi:MAG: hypothetical protein SO137_02480, partial [Gemmiger sp.]|uniref:hypothetical protein n=1 Tax=Gemmiger sp. TaxID=2049027 RepID=UPI002A7EEF75